MNTILPLYEKGCAQFREMTAEIKRTSYPIIFWPYKEKINGK